MEKKRGLGQFADLGGGLVKKMRVVFLMEGEGLILKCALRNSDMNQVMLKIYVIKYGNTMRQSIFQDMIHCNYIALILSNFTRTKFQRVHIRLIVNWLQF